MKHPRRALWDIKVYHTRWCEHTKQFWNSVEHDGKGLRKCKLCTLIEVGEEDDKRWRGKNGQAKSYHSTITCPKMPRLPHQEATDFLIDYHDLNPCSRCNEIGGPKNETEMERILGERRDHGVVRQHESACASA